MLTLSLMFLTAAGRRVLLQRELPQLRAQIDGTFSTYFLYFSLIAPRATKCRRPRFDFRAEPEPAARQRLGHPQLRPGTRPRRRYDAAVLPREEVPNERIGRPFALGEEEAPQEHRDALGRR